MSFAAEIFRRRLMTSLHNYANTGTDCCVRWWDYKGNIVKEQWVSRGDSVKHPRNPSSDYPFMYFNTWSHTEDELSNVQHDYDVMAYYAMIDYRMRFKFEAKAGETLQLSLISTYTSTNSYAIEWGDGTTWQGTSETGENLTAVHTYENDTEGILRFSKGGGCSVVIETDGIVSGVFGIASSSGNYNYGIYAINKEIDYIAYDSGALPNSPYGSSSQISTNSPLVVSSKMNGLCHDGSAPMVFFKSGECSCYNMTGLQKFICREGATLARCDGNPDLTYIYISSSISSIEYGFKNNPNLERIDIEEGWVAPQDINLSSSTKIQQHSIKRFLSLIGATTTARIITLSTQTMALLSQEDIDAALAKGYTITA